MSLGYITGRHDEQPLEYIEMIGSNGMNNTVLGIVERSWEKLRKPMLIADYGILDVIMLPISLPVIIFRGLFN